MRTCFRFLRLRAGTPLDAIREGYIADRPSRPVERLLLSILLALIGLCIGLLAWLGSDPAFQQFGFARGLPKLPTLTSGLR
ncbi:MULTISPECIES: hypothetical protein [Microvirga]|uniref:hypothetical protein n=1 Tax=Microvirga TaxID=186650 RepID=UPI001CFF6CEA|nr:hypothetical protein [Microvirga lenta]MCB5176167.1 hypothetical protein [Microvirga lenta]